ncbi:MAG: GHKL domain-containing protein, partial [Firmicutes bacterium]|nr:GHKL domain-containing protein [Bacillota bacterium]
MERFLTILLYYLAVLPNIILCFVPVWEEGLLKYSKKRIIMFGIQIFALSTVVCAFIEYKFNVYSLLVLFPYYLVLFAAYIKVLHIDTSKSFLIFATVMVWFRYANAFAVLIAARLDPNGTPVSDNLVCDLLRIAAAVLIMISLYYPFKKYGSELIAKFHERKIWCAAAFVSVIFILMCFFMTPLKFETLYVNNVYLSYAFLIIATFILHLLLCMVFQFIIMGLLRSQEAENRNRFYEMRESEYIKQQRFIEENAKVRHDFKHTIRTIKQLAEKEDIAALKSFIEQYYETLPENDTILFCENNAANALLNYYHNLAHQSNILTKWKIDIPEQIQINEADLCNVIGNILDNAIAGCQEIPENKRSIILSVVNNHNADLYIVVTNTFSGKVNLRNERYFSTHRNGNGIGLTSIETIAESYGG